MTPRKRLELIRRLEQENLVDWSVALAYSRLYAGAVVSGAKEYDKRTPLEAVASLKKLEDEDLVSWHYGVPTEAILIAEALAMDEGFKQANPLDRLIKLRDLERKNLITTLNKKEMEKLPAWRFLVGDPTFLKANANMKQQAALEAQKRGTDLSTYLQGSHSDLHPRVIDSIFHGNHPHFTALRPNRSAVKNSG